MRRQTSLVEYLVCKRAKVESVEFINGHYVAKVCSWFGSEPICVYVNIDGIVRSLEKEEVERILSERCGGDEECREMEYDIALEEAREHIVEGKLLEIVATDFAREIVEQACPDMISNAPRR